MKKKWIVLILIAVLAVPAVYCGTFYHRGQSLKRSVLALDDAKQVTLDDIVPFDWDAVYTFPPYTAKSDIEHTLGIRSPFIHETVSEDMTQLIFTRGRSVIACITGYPGFNIEFAGRISAGENTVFTTEKTESGLLLLRQ